MPDGFDAVIIDTRFEAPTKTPDLSGKTLIVHSIVSDSVDPVKPSIKFYETYKDLIEDYPSTFSDIYKCATTMHNNNIEAMGVGTYDSRNDITDLYELMEAEARIHTFTSLVIANYTLDTSTYNVIRPLDTTEGDEVTYKKSLVKWCDENQIVLILAFTPPNGTNNVTVDTMINMVMNPTDHTLVSPNLYMVAYNDPTETVDDVAAAVAAVMECTEPEFTMMWKTVSCNVSKYFDNNDVRKLEGKSTDQSKNPHINVLLKDYGLSESYTTDRFISDYNKENSIVTDISISRSIYFIKRALQNVIISLRKNTAKLSYTSQSLGLIRAAICTVLEDNVVSALNPYGMISSYTVSVPTIEKITAYEKSLNILKNVSIEVVLAGEIHTFKFDLVVSLGSD